VSVSAAAHRSPIAERSVRDQTSQSRVFRARCLTLPAVSDRQKYSALTRVFARERATQAYTCSTTGGAEGKQEIRDRRTIPLGSVRLSCGRPDEQPSAHVGSPCREPTVSVHYSVSRPNARSYLRERRDGRSREEADPRQCVQSSRSICILPAAVGPGMERAILI
jgi:hypothetical protein